MTAASKSPTGDRSTTGGGNSSHGGNPANGGNQWLALLAVIAGAFVAILNNSLINVALPKLMAVFGSTTDTIQWVLTGYMLASGVIIPLSGYVGDRFGYKTSLVLSLTAFVLGSLLCSLAWNDSSLIAFRIVQGLGGGIIMPLSMAIIYKVMPPKQIGLALGLWGIAAMVAPAVGPTLSGYLVEYFSWRILFALNVPVGILSIMLVLALLKETDTRENLHFDRWGFLLFTIAAGSLLLALSQGQKEGWSSLYIVTLFFVSFFSFVFLIWLETGKKNPLLDLSLFGNLRFTISTLSSSLVMIGMFGGIFLTPLYLQNIQGLSAVQTGLILMPQAIAMGIMMPIAGRLFDRYGVLPLGLTGLTIVGITTYELHNLTVDTPNRWLDMVLTIRGIGIGLCMMPLTTAGMNAVEKHRIGQASGLGNVVRQIAGSFGIAVLTAIMQQRQTFHSARINEDVSLASDAALQAQAMLTVHFTQSGLDMASAKASAMAVLSGMIQKEAAVRAIADTFMLSAIPFFLAIPMLYFLRVTSPRFGSSNPLSTKYDRGR
ncbi:DHA2 family efflux MFS transporter permease subunit [Effusibacillus lacus]|uniref:MFS transporter n=1 Tax=Effusibacillus lacus TaxID=1348429 RepID=A0A292YUA8_9BACL|nr:DHA2 family efflux MFS transporter permease subunit [Effusibacillus lacus]TCS73755.1 EmrB/QacA subfamily drug resistance transporter [Effusibacillus lacus]GAX92034.1 MFS transporter [Effusibacillus lacus]